MIDWDPKPYLKHNTLCYNCIGNVNVNIFRSKLLFKTNLFVYFLLTVFVFLLTVFVLCVLLSTYVYLLYSYVYLLYYVCIAVFILDAGLLAISQYPEGPANGHLDTGFSGFPVSTSEC